MTRRNLFVALSIMVIAALPGCSRGIAVGSTSPGGSYSVMVANVTASDMDVSFNDGKDHPLGTVKAGKSQRFIVAGASRPNVTISGRAMTGSRSSGPYQVQLMNGNTVNVTLR